MSLTECYAHFGIYYDNSRDPPWSGQAEDGTVVLTLWSNRFLDVDRNVYYSGHHEPKTIDNPKNKLRIEHLHHATDKNACIFQSIIVTPTDPPRNTEGAKFELGARMRLIDLEENTGEFRAERAR